jgi:hypothetical protein
MTLRFLESSDILPQMAARNELSLPAGAIHWNGFNRDAINPGVTATREKVIPMYNTTDLGIVVRLVYPNRVYVTDKILLIIGSFVTGEGPDDVKLVYLRALDNTKEGLRISQTKPEYFARPGELVTIVGVIDAYDPKNRDFYKSIDFTHEYPAHNLEELLSTP